MGAYGEVATDSQQISLSNKESDSQLLLIVLRKQVNSKEPMADLKKQVVDPWVAQLINQYKVAGISVVREAAYAEVGGQQAEGMKLKFFLDNNPGGAEAYWVLLDKRLVMLYFIRPDKVSDKAEPGLEAIRKSLKVVSNKQ